MNSVTLLDGATGTELSRRGYDTRLPLWSARPLADHPEAVLEIHRDYLRAGARILTACTFRTHARNLASAGWASRSDELNQLAIDAARSAMALEGVSDARVAGSLSSIEDCFRVDLVPPDEQLQEEHRRQAESLARAGSDVILVETMGSQREATAAVTAAVATGVETWCSFLSRGDGRLYSGEDLGDAVRTVEQLGASAILVNCVAATAVRRDVEILSRSTSGSIGAYANIGHADQVDGWRVDLMLAPADFAHCMAELVSCRATLLGGCCGTQPEHIAALNLLLGDPAGVANRAVHDATHG